MYAKRTITVGTLESERVRFKSSLKIKVIKSNREIAGNKFENWVEIIYNKVKNSCKLLLFL
jgi:hypothetical protein